MSANNREEFDQRTKDVIAARAGHRCSFPACSRITIGPGATSDQIASCGVAAHIFSASPGGPRGQGELTAECLSSASNGIWLCANHAREVDANDGRGYPASLLFSYKALREARANLEMSGITTPTAWIESIEIHRCQLAHPKPHALVRPEAKLNLAKITLLLGTNSSGKTAVCEWLAGAMDASALWRWCDDDVDYSLRLYSPDEHAVRIRTGDGTVLYELDGKPCVFNPLPLRMQWLSAPLGGCREGRSEIEFLAEYLRDTTEGIRRLIDHYRRHREDRVVDRWLEDLWIEDRGKVMVRASWEKHDFSFGQLGSGGRGAVALALAVLRASTAAWHSPTLLLVDNLFPSLDSETARSALRLLGSAHRQFQTLITSCEKEPKFEWDGWAVKRLLPSEGGAKLDEL